MGSHFRKAIRRLELFFQLEIFCFSRFLLELQVQHTAVLLEFATATKGLRVLFESSVAPGQLGAASAFATECSCARECFATRHDNTLYPPRTWHCSVNISVRFIIYRIFKPILSTPPSFIHTAFMILLLP